MRSVRQVRAKGATKVPATGGRPRELFEPINHSTMHERVYEQIRDAFASGRVVPGQRIVIREFARSFGTSMMPIRDALRRLEAEHAVVTTTGRNLAVPIMTASDYEELCLIRVSLEGLAASEAAKTITEAQIQEASECAGGMEDAFDFEGRGRHYAFQQEVSLQRLRWRASPAPAEDDREFYGCASAPSSHLRSGTISTAARSCAVPIIPTGRHWRRSVSGIRDRPR